MNTKSFIKIDKLKKALNKFNSIKPFPYVVIDNFLNLNLAKKIEKIFHSILIKNYGVIIIIVKLKKLLTIGICFHQRPINCYHF